MKKLYFIILILISLKSFGQYNYIPINFNNSSWNYVGYIIGDFMMPEQIDLYRCQFENDTLINSTQYHKFKYEKHSWYNDESGYSNYIGTSTDYIGAIREDGFEYYFVPRESETEILLYNFDNISEGETIWEDISSNDVIVIDSIRIETMMDNIDRKVYYGLQYGYKVVKLIEGIGIMSVVQGGLIPSNFITSDFEIYDGGFNIDGYCENGDIVDYCGYFSAARDCDFTLRIEEKFISEDFISVFPNPTTGIINLGFREKNIECLIVRNITGKYIIEKTEIQQNEQIDLSGFDSGIYIISIQTDNEIFTTKIIKK